MPKRSGITAADFALAWVLNNKLITSAIAGPRTEEQWDGYRRARWTTRFTAEDEALVDRLVAPGHTSTPGFTDPGHPVEGRVPRIGATNERLPEAQDIIMDQSSTARTQGNIFPPT